MKHILVIKFNIDFHAVLHIMYCQKLYKYKYTYVWFWQKNLSSRFKYIFNGGTMHCMHAYVQQYTITNQYFLLYNQCHHHCHHYHCYNCYHCYHRYHPVTTPLQLLPHSPLLPPVTAKELTIYVYYYQFYQQIMM